MIEGYRLYKGAWIFEHDPHKEHKLSNEDIQSLLSKGGLMIRNAFDFDCGHETSFWYVIKDSFGGMEELSSKMRNQVKKCFKTMRVGQLSPEELKEKGYPVFVEASNSYKVESVPPTQEEFNARIDNAEENEFWGCYDIETEKLVAFSMNAVTNESCEYRTMKAIPAFQKQYAYYGLIYEMNRFYLEERKLKYVNDGGRSITNHSNIQPFLIEKFNFRKAYCNFDIHYKWWLGVVVKVMYPFRKLIKVRQVQSLLNMEAMAHNAI